MQHFPYTSQIPPLPYYIECSFKNIIRYIRFFKKLQRLKSVCFNQNISTCITHKSNYRTTHTYIKFNHTDEIEFRVFLK